LEFLGEFHGKGVELRGRERGAGSGQGGATAHVGVVGGEPGEEGGYGGSEIVDEDASVGTDEDFGGAAGFVAGGGVVVFDRGGHE
jgi:hypothetical protein